MLDSQVVFESLPLDYSMSFPYEMDVIFTEQFEKYMENPCWSFSHASGSRQLAFYERGCTPQ